MLATRQSSVRQENSIDPGSYAKVLIPVNPATDSGVIRPLVRAKRRCCFIISPCGRNESMEIYVFS